MATREEIPTDLTIDFGNEDKNRKLTYKILVLQKVNHIKLGISLILIKYS